MDENENRQISEDFWDRSVNWIVGPLITLGVISGVGIIAAQAYVWIRRGTWLALPLVLLFEHLGVDLDRVYNPKDWFGLAWIARWLLELPLSFALPAGLIAAAMGWKALVNRK